MVKSKQSMYYLVVQISVSVEILNKKVNILSLEVEIINYCKGQRSQKNNSGMPTLCNERMNSSEFQV